MDERSGGGLGEGIGTLARGLVDVVDLGDLREPVVLTQGLAGVGWGVECKVDHLDGEERSWCSMRVEGGW